MPINPRLQRIVEQLSAGSPDWSSLSPAEARRSYEEMRRKKISGPESLNAVRDIDFSLPGRTVRARFYNPGGGPAMPLIVYFHGGGWVVGSVDTHDDLCRRIARVAGAAVLSVDYRLAPEHPFPAAVEDAYDAVAYAFSHAADLGVDPVRISVAGDSAGGNLAAAVAIAARDKRSFSLEKQVLLYPVMDADFSTPSYRELGTGLNLTRDAMKWYWDQYAPSTADRENPLAAPLREKTLGGLPPALVLTAEFDPLRDEGEQYAHRLRQEGTPVRLVRMPETLHGFALLTDLFPEAHEAVSAIADFLADRPGNERTF